MFSIEKDIEITAVHIKNLSLIVICIYRSPMGNIEQFLINIDLALTEIVSKYQGNIVLAGDFNINFLKNTKETVQLIELMETYGLHEIFREPSRKTSISTTCIDNIFTTIQCDDVYPSTLNLHVSDHFTQMIKIRNRTKVKEQYKWIRLFNKGNIDNFKKYLQARDWSLIAKNDAEKSFEVFQAMLQDAFFFNFPEKKVLYKNNTKQILHTNAKIKELNNKLEASHTIYKVRKDEDSLRLYRELKRKLRDEIEMELKIENEKIINSSENKSKAIWSIINENTKQKCEHPPSTLTADDFNSFFVEIGKKLTEHQKISEHKYDTYLTKMNFNINNSIFLFDTNPHEIINEVSKMKAKTSRDIYGLSMKLIKEVIEHLAEPLSYIINLCFFQGIFPYKLKIARVVPIYKKEDRNHCENYRPISVLPVISKIFEVLIKTRLLNYIDKHTLINKHQHGFRKARSTVTAMTSILESTLEALDNKEDVELTCLDLSKAFDCINHANLLRKLEYYGIRGHMLALIKSYLSDRQQVVNWNGVNSKEKNINIGVPQGSILGPIFFIIYTNDLPKSIDNSEVFTYADDTTILTTGKTQNSLQLKSQGSIKNAQDWLQANGLILNLEKTQTITVTTKNTEQKTLSLLGFTLDTKISWWAHLSNLCRKLSTAIYTIRRIRQVVNEEAATVTYFAHFHSLATYGIMLWGASTDANNVFLKQKRAIRTIVKISHTESCREHFKKLRILTIPSVFILTCLMYTHGNRGNLKSHEENHSYLTRNRELFIHPRHRLCKTQNFVTYLGIKMYNRLPTTMKNLDEKHFKKAIKDILLQLTFYSTEEFFNHAFAE